MAKTAEEGKKAPAFTMPTDGDGQVSLKDYKGKKLVLFFYPRDNTPGCTTESIGFSENLTKFRRAGADILGVSKDSIASHERFKEKQGLKMTLASDKETEVIEAYGSWVEKNNYGRKYMGIERSTFLIDESGKILKIWRKVKVKGHVDEVLDTVKSLKS
jgi:thioredoxin-dependent peroxiredoxin